VWAVETFGSKQSYALTWCMPNDDDDDDVDCNPIYRHTTWSSNVVVDKKSRN